LAKTLLLLSKSLLSELLLRRGRLLLLLSESLLRLPKLLLSESLLRLDELLLLRLNELLQLLLLLLEQLLLLSKLLLSELLLSKLLLLELLLLLLVEVLLRLILLLRWHVEQLLLLWLVELLRCLPKLLLIKERARCVAEVAALDRNVGVLVLGAGRRHHEEGKGLLLLRLLGRLDNGLLRLGLGCAASTGSPRAAIHVFEEVHGAQLVRTNTSLACQTVGMFLVTTTVVHLVQRGGG
jgi:hypothetical protein